MQNPHHFLNQAYHPYIQNQVTYTNHIHVNRNEFYSVTCMSMPLYIIPQNASRIRN